jgi:hypothetical protein
MIRASKGRFMRAALSLLLGIVIVAPLAAQEKPRVFIAASAAWRENDEGAGARAEPEIRRVEIAADFSHSCGSVVVTADYKVANYIAEFSRHVTKVPLTGIAVDRTDVGLYRPSADLVGAATKTSVSAAVKAACEVIKKDWPTAPHEIAPKPPRDARPTGRPTAFDR